ncbi:MAG TPA: hypothetical protein DCL49_13745 [Candidatus Omnitrophica bacterium]|nr:hypothetical protein [Candidatus Omnitrophota bacterium]HBG62624.1 hypothetical protein [Candidatus Omnitrophota bacterium]
MITCYLGLGSNLGEREKNITTAVRFLNSEKDIKVIKASGLYETRPQGCPQGTPFFLNAAIKINTRLKPRSLLRTCKHIERLLGRKKTRKRFSSRPIDLDILFYGRQKINLPDLKVPHPRLGERDFVIKPLKEIAPGLIRALSRQTKIVAGIVQMRNFITKEKAKGKTIGFVPTMGYLHQGHLSLIRQAKKDCDICVVSIFVNPMQFGPKEDYAHYPRDLEQDSILAKSAGCDCIFYPGVKEMYPQGYNSFVTVEKLTENLCGASRPGHFKGVTTVVAKLFNIIQPDRAYFGQKDYQQALLVTRMAEDLNMPLSIKVMPIVREADGLAMSSRNVYLNSRQRLDAVIIYQSLQKAREMIARGERNSRAIITRLKKEILKKKSATIDYIAVVDAKTLEIVKRIKGKVLIGLAVWIGRTRLIDNIVIR